MTDVSLIHTSGGLLGDVFIDALRQPGSDSTTRVLADPSTFTGSDGNPPTRTAYENDLDAAFKSATAVWSAYRDEIDTGMDVSRLRDRVLIPLLRNLGFDPVYQRARLAAGDQFWAISHLGWDSPDAPPVLLVPDDDLDARGTRKRSPHEELQGFLNNSPVRWGIVTNGRVLRVLRDYHHTRTRGYVEAELAAIFDSSSMPDFIALYRLTHGSRFRPLAPPAAVEPLDTDNDTDDDTGPVATGAVPDTLLEKAYAENLNAGVAAGKRLQPRVRDALEALANGLLKDTPGLRQRLASDPTAGRDFYRETLTVLYRILFLFFAEQRHMLDRADPLYQQTYSLTSLRARAEADDAEPRRHDLWEGLKTTFRLFSDPEAAATVGVYPYNGQLFNLTRTPITTAGRSDNKHVLDVISLLTTVPSGGIRLHVDYRNLGVEELGTVYEALLDYTLTIRTTAVNSQGRVIPAGQAYLAPLSTERADLAAYYTPADLVDLLLERSLDQLIAERLTAAGADRDAQELALLSLKVIDPACGSAAILIGALDRIATALATVRTAPHEPRDTDLAAARRDVLQRCIYGIDKDPFAVELAKVALWIHCVVPDQPLSYLDSRIVCGDALVGWPLLDLPSDVPNAAYEFTKATTADKKCLTEARKRNSLYVEDNSLFSLLTVDPHLTLPDDLAAPETTYDDVRRKAQAYDAWRASDDYRRWKAAADIWTATYFWTAADGDAPTTAEYQAAVRGEADATLVSRAEEILRDLNPLHWPLAFPDARAAGGFDMVIGNPPWEVSASIEQEFFAQSAPQIAALTSEHRGAAINHLSLSDPALHARWQAYKSKQARFSQYAKTCQRYTRTGSKTNTYVLFIEAAARAARAVALIVKSGIATDEAQSPVWRRLLSEGRVSEVTDIVNAGPAGRPVFPAVALVERFSVLVLDSPKTDRALAASMLNFGVDEARTAAPRRWTNRELATVAPRTQTLLSTSSAAEIVLAIRLQREFPTLDFAYADPTNPWGIYCTTLFNSTYAKTDGLLLRPEALRERGFALQADRTFRHSDGRAALPVYEGQMANRWDHRARTYEGYRGTNKYGRKPHIPHTDEVQHADPAFEVEPRYWMQSDVALARIHQVAGDRWLLAHRDIGAVWTNRRSVRVALMPRYPATHTLPVISVEPERAFALAAVLNSMTFDFLARVHMPGGHVTPWIMSQCAAPLPASITHEMIRLAEALSVTSNRLSVVTGHPVTRWDDAQRDAMDAELDARVAIAYGLGRDEYEVVLDHFALLRRIEERPTNFGEYRSKRLRLEAFDRIGGRT